MECDFTFSSWYPVNKTSVVYIDVNDSVDESDEGNNSASISPFGVSAP
jgi:subtilase family serine protease